jgi:hypothetical protein
MEHRVQDGRRDRGDLLGGRRERGADCRLATLSFHRRCSAWFGGLELLFVTPAHAADFIFDRQAEAEERAGGLRGSDENLVG